MGRVSNMSGSGGFFKRFLEKTGWDFVSKLIQRETKNLRAQTVSGYSERDLWSPILSKKPVCSDFWYLLSTQRKLEKCAQERNQVPDWAEPKSGIMLYDRFCATRTLSDDLVNTNTTTLVPAISHNCPETAVWPFPSRNLLFKKRWRKIWGVLGC